ncbi:MraY family glycosyltransferase [Magnetofaba australis]|uniref:Putative glycosyl transferase family protein n=1 Tax=Magnetofaba australis IT-1 TaxID=1434232 RepID=A0A1Y2K3Z8_9PROT|nr:MraY family glycosyltransferase [Magnetofaba australis]OSM02366.1 putative glycosyl transferase family protein [Magnetofaba australis IT-1]
MLMDFLIALAATLASLEALRRIAPRLGLMDRPDARKRHAVPTPLVGGLALNIGVFVGWLCDPALVADPAVQSLMLGMGALLIVGVWDDRRELSVRVRFLTQIGAAAVLIVWGDVTVRQLGDLVGVGLIELGPLHGLFTAICVVGVINALNMVDGLDGLSGSLALVSLLTLLALAMTAGQAQDMRVIALLLGGVVGFWLYNARIFGRSRALVFMGDAGSMVLGLALAWLTIHMTQQTPAAMSASSALWVVLVPLVDMFSSLFRRLSEGSKPFGADRRHFHHWLQANGLSVNATVLTMSALAVLGGAAAFWGDASGVPQWVRFVAINLLCFVYFLSVRRFWRARGDA